jgi:hypothetical protein
MKPMAVPTEADWRSEPWDIDTAYAYENFFGKSLAEAFDLFVENAIRYQEDILFMPLACFEYYVHAYIDYLLSDKSKGDSDGANCFFGLVDNRKTDIRSSVDDLRSRVVEVLTRLRSEQQWYDANPGIYGDFAARADEAMKLIESQPNGN